MMRYLSCLCIACALLWSASAMAERRVLFKFDDSGIQVHRVVDLMDESGIPISQSNSPEAEFNLEGEALLFWLDEAGETIDTAQVADPRIVQSPDHTSAAGRSPSVSLGLEQGGWIANAPDEAVSVVINLPDWPTLGLSSETWTLSLVGKK